MGEHRRLAEGVLAAAGRHVQRYAGQRLHERERGAVEFQRNQRRPDVRQRQAKLRGQPMRQTGRAHLEIDRPPVARTRDEARKAP